MKEPAIDPIDESRISPGEMPEELMRDTRHPELPAVASDAPGLDRLVSGQHSYSQGHWRDSLVRAIERMQMVRRAAQVEVDALRAELARLERELDGWLMQVEAHEAAEGALREVFEGMKKAEDARGEDGRGRSR